MKKPSKFVFDAMVLTISGIIVKVIATVFNIYISKKVGTEALGVYHMLIAIYMFGTNIAVAGLSLTTIKIVSKEEALGNNTKVYMVMRKIIKYAGCMGCVAAMLISFSSSFLVKNVLNNLVSKKVIYILSASLPFLSISYSLNGYFSAKRKVFKSSLLQIFDQVSKVCMMTYLLGVYLPGSVENACIALILSETICEVVYCAITLCLYKHEVKRTKVRVGYKSFKEIEDEKKIKKEVISIAFPVAFTACVRSGLNTLKQATIPKSLEKSNMSYKEAISEYGVVTGMAMPIISFMAVFIQPFSSLLLPQFSEYAAKNDRQKILKTIDKVFSTTINYAICIMGGLWAFANELGEMLYQNTDVGWYIKMLCPLVVFMYLDSTVDSMLRGLDKQVAVMVCNILDLIVSILFIYLVVPLLGVKGYIASMFLSTILNASISIAILINTVNFKFKLFKWVILPSIFAVISILITNFLLQKLKVSFIGLAIKFGIYILSYIICYKCIKFKKY